jgi:hypothetical protein
MTIDVSRISGSPLARAPVESSKWTLRVGLRDAEGVLKRLGSSTFTNISEIKYFAVKKHFIRDGCDKFTMNFAKSSKRAYCQYQNSIVFNYPRVVVDRNVLFTSIDTVYWLIHIQSHEHIHTVQPSTRDIISRHNERKSHSALSSI